MNKRILYSIIATLFLLCGCFFSNGNDIEIRGGFVCFHENSGIELSVEVFDASGRRIVTDLLMMKNDQKCDSVEVLRMGDCFESTFDASFVVFPLDSFPGKTLKICNITHGDRGMQCISYTVPQLTQTSAPPTQNP